MRNYQNFTYVALIIHTNIYIITENDTMGNVLLSYKKTKQIQ